MAAGSKNRIAAVRTVVTFMVLPRFNFTVKEGNSKAALDGLANSVAKRS